MFDEHYYKNDNYVAYLDRSEKYKRTARELEKTLDMLNLNKEPYLDFGCAVGHLVNGFMDMFIDIEGYDISDWAVEYGKHKWHLPLTSDFSQLTKERYGVTFFLDVLEHLEESTLETLFAEKIKTDALVFRMPVPATTGGDYVLGCSRNDPTHNIRWTKDEWKAFFNKHGYSVLSLSLNTIYDTDGVYCGLGIKGI